MTDRRATYWCVYWSRPDRTPDTPYDGLYLLRSTAERIANQLNRGDYFPGHRWYVAPIEGTTLWKVNR